jgi:type IV pilus assembly protein PilC
MAQFHYKAARLDGTSIQAVIDGDSEAAVRSQLERQGLLIFGIARRGAGRTWPKPGTGGRLSLREFLVFNQELSALVKAGLPILRVVDLLAERAIHPGFQAALQGVRADIRGGASIADALAHYPQHFPELYRASLRSGEQTGHLVDVLQRYISHLKLMIEVREKVVKALAYPMFLIAVGIAVVAFLLIYVMPIFADIYGQTKTTLPAPTRLLLSVVEHSAAVLPWAVGGTVGAILLGARWVRSPAGRVQFDRLSLRVPIIGDILLKNQVIRMSRTLSTILAGGIPLLTAMQITGAAMTNRVIVQALERATNQVRDGMSLAAALMQERFLPRMTIEMIEVGETTGSLETMLQDVAVFHEGELDLRLSQLTTWIEPVLLLVMGFLVGGIVIVMYLPIFQMAGSV